MVALTYSAPLHHHYPHDHPRQRRDLIGFNRTQNVVNYHSRAFLRQRVRETIRMRQQRAQARRRMAALYRHYMAMPAIRPVNE